MARSRKKKSSGLFKKRFNLPLVLFVLLLIILPIFVIKNQQQKLTTDAANAILDKSIFDRKDLIYGSEIGAWDMDGGAAINNPTARQNIMDAKIRVIRWGNWAKFDYMGQGGSTPKQTLAQFNNAVDGIRSLGAIPFIKLPPIWDKQCDGAEDYWNLDWQKEIIKNAGNRVQLYEFANEPDNYCGWNGTTYGQNWINTVPALKKYARSLGFEIFVGGPAAANNYTWSVAITQDFMTAVKDEYVRTGDPDLIPNFASSHLYPNSQENVTLQDYLNRIDYWGGVYDQMRSAIDTTWSGINDSEGNPIGPQIKLAASEWGVILDDSDQRVNDPNFVNPYITKLFQMFRAHDIWLANQFTIQSHGGGALDLLNTDGTPKVLYNAYAAVSTTDPLNNPQQPTATNAPTNTPVPSNSPTPTRVPTVTSKPTLTPTPKPAYSIYLDTLTSGWTNRSWSANVNFSYTKQKYAGVRSIQYIANAGWSGFAVGNNNFSTKGYRYLKFAAKASAKGQKYAIGLTNTSGSQYRTPQPLSNYGGDPVSNSWKVYKIPLADLNGTNVTLGSIVIQEWKGTSQPALYIDNIQLVN